MRVSACLPTSKNREETFARMEERKPFHLMEERKREREADLVAVARIMVPAFSIKALSPPPNQGFSAIKSSTDDYEYFSAILRSTFAIKRHIKLVIKGS